MLFRDARGGPKKDPQHFACLLCSLALPKERLPKEKPANAAFPEPPGILNGGALRNVTGMAQKCLGGFKATKSRLETCFSENQTLTR